MPSDNNTPKPQRTIDERIDAFAASIEEIHAIQKEHAFSMKLHAEMIVPLDPKLENLTVKIDMLTENSKRDAENIRALARIAEMHDPRLTAIEGDQPAQ